MPRKPPWGECARCGFNYLLTELKREWTGLRVCLSCFDPRPADQRAPNYKPEGLPVRNASPKHQPRWKETTTPTPTPTPTPPPPPPPPPPPSPPPPPPPPPPVYLHDLSFSDTAFVAGVAESGTILGATPGSTITAAGLPAGLTINSAARTWAWAGVGGVNGSFTLTETLAGYANSPHPTIINYNITVPAPPPPPPPPPPGGGVTEYDDRYGTDTATAASTGWFTFGLRPGCRRVWVNSTQANDSGDGLTAATAKKTLNAAKALFGTSPTPGDQLMIAGTGGRSYADSTYNFTLDFAPGFSATYPTAYLCYDPANPADSTKYGKLLGQDRPRILLPTDGSPSAFSTTWGFDATVSNIAIQGLIFDCSSVGNGGVSLVYRHDHVIVQNCQFIEAAFSHDNANSSLGFSQGGNVSKCSFYGVYDNRGVSSSGNASALFTAEVNGFRWEDNVFVHCGWKIGVTRDDTLANGAPAVFGHACYYGAACTNGLSNRNVYVDSAADGWGMRGDVAATQLFSWDEPIVGALTGVSTSYTEKPLGALATIDDFASMGGSNLNSTVGGGERGSGIGVNNGAVGTHARNGVMFDNPKYSGANGNNWLLGMTSLGAGAAASTVLMDKIRTWNAFAYAASIPTSPPNSITATWTNCLLDSLTTNSSPISGTGVRTWTGGDYPNAKTADQVATDMLNGMGVTPGASYAARKAQVVNYMLEYPHLPWAQAFLGIAFTAYGATPQYPTASVPSVSGLSAPTTVYTSTTPTRI